MSNTKTHLRRLAFGLALAALAGGELQAQTTTLNPDWRVTPDTTKPGFKWNYFSNNGNTANNTARTEAALNGLLKDATGAPLPNLGDPTVVGAAIAEAAPANPENGLLYFEITNVINLNKVDGGSAGNFNAGNSYPDALEPGVNPNVSTDGQAAEILTYLTFPQDNQTIAMVVNSDDGFQTSSGFNPSDVFGRVVLGEFSGGRGAADTPFRIFVEKAGTYAFRTIFENGGGDSNIEWFTVDNDLVSNRVLINDVANGGIPAYRATSGGVVPPYIKSVTPSAAPRQTESISRSVTVVLADGSTAVDTNSITLSVDGTSATITKERLGNQVTVDTGVLPGFHAAGEAHTAVLTYKDVPGTYSRTQQWTFYNLENLILPATPVTGENFDSYPEATDPTNAAPPGWTLTNYSWLEKSAIGVGWDLTDVANDPFTNWVMITTATVLPLEDEVLDNNKAQTINGIPLTDPNNWMSNNLIFAASDGRARRVSDANGNLPNDYAPQIQIAVSAPFNLSTVTNPVLTFSSGVRISGNHEQNSLEYSVDNGANWLPALILQNAGTHFLNADGTYDAVKMLTNVWADVARFPVVQDPDSRDFISAGPLGGKFGDVLLTPISAALAPYIVERNDTVAARRVEAIRLPAASQKSQVRLRFVHYGSCGWEWGVDNIAFYDIPGGAPQAVPLVITGITPVGQAVTITWTGGAGPYLLQKKFSLNDTNWLNVLTTPDKSATVALQGAASFFRVVDGATTTVTPLTAFLSGDAERPTGNASTATGLGSFSLEGNTLNYYITFSGLSANASAAHIHGPTNTTASTGVIIPFSPPAATSGVISGSVTVTDQQKGWLLGGLTYANIHDTPNFGGGEIRGQIGPTQLKASLNGANENPPVATAGTGSGTLTRIGNQLLFNITYNGLSSPANNAHIHGRTDVADPAGVLVALPTPTGTSGTLSGTLTLNNATLSAIVDGVSYVNIHTANNGGGEIRGQITP